MTRKSTGASSTRASVTRCSGVGGRGDSQDSRGQEGRGFDPLPPSRGVDLQGIQNCSFFPSALQQILPNLVQILTCFAFEQFRLCDRTKC